MIRNSKTTTTKNTFFADILINSKNSKDTWRAINLLTNKHAPANTSTTSGISPDDLNNHFCIVASKVIKRDNPPINELTLLEQYCTENISHEASALPFNTVREVYKSLCHLKQSNTKGTDGLDGKIPRLSAPFIAETLIYIYWQEHFPPWYLRKQKLSPSSNLVTNRILQTLGPISILPILSKPLEKYINEHVRNHFLVNDLFYQKQSGFRPKPLLPHSLTELIDTWLSEININKLCVSLFIDFAKAFDVINHDLLLRKLTLYGLSENTLSLICSFLNSRLQKVSLKDNQSDFKRKKWVPQGSVLGPLLFSIYMNDLPLHIPSAECDMLADDKTIHTSGQDVPAITTVLQSCLSDVVEETHLNHMSLNPSKTKYMILTTRQKRQLLHSPSAHLSVGNQQINEVSDHKVLGVTIDT